MDLEKKAKCVLLKQLMEDMGGGLIEKLKKEDGVKVMKVQEDPEEGEVEIEAKSVQLADGNEMKEALDKVREKVVDEEDEEEDEDESFLELLPDSLKKALLKAKGE